MILDRIYSSLISDNLKKDILVYSSAQNIVSSGIITLFVAPFFALLYYFLNFPLAAYLILLTGFMIFLSILTLKYIGSLTISRELFIIAIFSLFAWLSYACGGLLSPAIFWLILPPFLAAKFGGIKSGLFWTVMSVLVIVGIFSLENSQYPFPPSPLIHLQLLRCISTAGLVLILFSLAYFFEMTKREITYELEHAKGKTEFLFEKAQEASRIKSEVLENLSHEFRTPLNIIQTSAEMFNVQDNAENQEYATYIIQSTKDLTQMVDNMLDISKIEYNQMSFSPETINLYNLIYETKMIHKKDIGEKKITFMIQVDPKIKQIYIDPIRLRQIISLYISNAIKFTPPNGRIFIRAFEVNDKMKIEVEDNGIGIHEKDITKLFVPFQQVDSSDRKRYKGTGIGLALVRRIVERQGGEVGVRSVYGAGSTFYLILPFKN